MNELVVWGGLDEESLALKVLASPVAQRAFAEAFTRGLDRLSESVKSSADAHPQEMTELETRSTMDPATVARTLASPAARDLLLGLLFDEDGATSDDSLRRALQT
jgi:hypothetical protein